MRTVELYVQIAVAVHLREKDVFKRQSVFLQHALHVGPGKMQRFEAAPLDLSFEDQKIRKRSRPRREVELLLIRLLKRRFFEHAQRAVRFEDRVGDLADVEDVLECFPG